MPAQQVEATPPASLDCLALSTILPGKVSFPGSTEYISFQSSYFAAFENEVSPVCIVQPESANDVSKIVKYLSVAATLSNVKVAVKGGGHTAWAGAANVEKGVIIDLVKLKGVDIDQERGFVSIAGGENWGNVYEELQKFGLAAVGGRVSKVGVGGLTTGGMQIRRLIILLRRITDALQVDYLTILLKLVLCATT